MNHFKKLSVCFVLLITLICCKPAYHSFTPSYKKEFAVVNNNQPDYSNVKYWAAHPWKTDPSDSIPLPLKNEKRDSTVDVFFLHPTTLTDKKTEAVIWNADIDNAELNAKTDYSSILYQASVFNASCRVFAPRYRQAHLYSFFTKDSTKGKAALRMAYEDVRSAFEYYLKHYNNGRPIIIAGHSQGTLHAQLLLKHFFDGTALAKQLVCAYIPGLVISKNEFTVLQPCTDNAGTGCFVGWRTYRKNYTPEFIEKENGNSWVVNPVSWTIDSLYHDRDKNTGAVLYNFKKIIPHTNGAQIHNGMLWVERPKFPGSFLYRSKNYHPGDINLFYINIRENIKDRIQSYFEKQ